jgi:hypothetical protein
LTPMVNFLQDFIRKEETSISKPLPRMKFIFHKAYATLELAFYVQTFYNVTPIVNFEPTYNCQATDRVHFNKVLISSESFLERYGDDSLINP